MSAILQRSNAEVWQCEMKGIFYENNALKIKAKRVIKNKEEKLLISDSEEVFQLSSVENSSDDFLIWMRKDPPVDSDYMNACQLLSLSSFPVINDPRALIIYNEKLLTLEFPQYIPNTWITNDKEFIRSELTKYKKLILKPLHGSQGKGVFVLNYNDKNTNSIIETVTNFGKNKGVLQE